MADTGIRKYLDDQFQQRKTQILTMLERDYKKAVDTVDTFMGRMDYVIKTYSSGDLPPVENAALGRMNHRRKNHGKHDKEYQGIKDTINAYPKDTFSTREIAEKLHMKTKSVSNRLVCDPRYFGVMYDSKGRYWKKIHAISKDEIRKLVYGAKEDGTYNFKELAEKTGDRGSVRAFAARWTMDHKNAAAP